MKAARRLVALSLVAMALQAIPALAEDGGLRVPKHAPWRSECGGCHVPYPPGLLAAADWRKLMSRLDRHFGSNASLDDGTRQDIQRFLERHASRSDRHASVDGRITTSRWFRSEHREVSGATLRNIRIDSFSRCEACHTGAADGRYGEREIRLPGDGETRR